jgi:hypothetical protein
MSRKFGTSATIGPTDEILTVRVRCHSMLTKRIQ